MESKSALKIEPIRPFVDSEGFGFLLPAVGGGLERIYFLRKTEVYEFLDREGAKDHSYEEAVRVLMGKRGSFGEECGDVDLSG